MQPLRLLFSPAGRLSPQAFVLGAIGVYAAGVASQWLTMPDVLARGGLWPFTIAQAILVWIWFALHAKRLRDAGRPIGLAVGVALLYTLAVVLLLTVAAAFFNTSTIEATDANTTSALGLLMLAFIVATLLGSPQYDVTWLMVAILSIMALLPIVVTLIFSLWAATRPGGEQRKA